jgi:hypothetical protein
MEKSSRSDKILRKTKPEKNSHEPIVAKPRLRTISTYECPSYFENNFNVKILINGKQISTQN